MTEKAPSSPHKTFFKEPPDRDEDYKKWISTLPCVACGRRNPEGNDPHHTETGGRGIKGSDYSCISLCHQHHQEVHARGKKTFAKRYGIDYESVTTKLFSIYQEIQKLKEK